MTQIGAAVANSLPAQNGAKLTFPARLYGTMPYNSSGSVQGLGYYKIGAADTSSGNRFQSGTGRLVFVTDEPKPIIICGGDSATYCINVDDGIGPKRVYDSTLPTGAPNYVDKPSFAGAASPGFGTVQLDFSTLGGRKKRIFEIAMFGDTAILQIGITATSRYYAPPVSPKIAFVADSLGGTVSLGNMKDAYVSQSLDLLGVRDTWLVSEGGTGFIAQGPGNAFRTHKQKLQALFALPQASGLALLVIQPSVNDNGNSSASITAAASDALTYALATWPGMPIIVTGCTAQNNTGSQAQAIANETAVFAAVDAIASPLVAKVPYMTAPQQIVSGTGNSNAPAGDGNADLLFNSADGTHFQLAGHTSFAADWAVPGIITALRKWIGEA
jgi:hypothetical protein